MKKYEKPSLVEETIELEDVIAMSSKESGEGTNIKVGSVFGGNK